MTPSHVRRAVKIHPMDFRPLISNVKAFFEQFEMLEEEINFGSEMHVILQVLFTPC
jgi:hypothetical protein